MATEVAYRGGAKPSPKAEEDKIKPKNELFFCFNFEFFYLVFSYSEKQNPKNK